MVVRAAAFLGVALMGLCGGVGSAEPARVQYLSDIVYGIQRTSPDRMGTDTTSYTVWPKYELGAPINIAGKDYAKGLGVDGSGEMALMLDGEYETFEAEVGIQTGSTGSAVFRVIVDGKEVYHSDQITDKDEARPLKVSVAGVREMRLIVEGSGKTIWANARMTPADTVSQAESLDMGRFAEVVSFDPEKVYGVAKSYAEGVGLDIPFPAKEVFPGKDVPASSDGSYTVPKTKSGVGCIGLQWMEQRRIKELGIQFADASSMPSTDGVRVEAWVGLARDYVTGESAWQGRWKPLPGVIERKGDTWVFEASDETRKIRWIFPASDKPIVVRKLTATTHAQSGVANLLFQLEKPMPGKVARIEMYNGEIVGQGGPVHATWDLGAPLHLKVCYTKPRPWGLDRTVVRVELPSGSFGVAVDDLLPDEFVLKSKSQPGQSTYWRGDDEVIPGLHALGCVYAKEFGLFATAEPAKVSLDEYKKRVADRKTILERVRAMPDQTFEQAIARTMQPSQDATPNTTISLAWDDRKANVDRTGAIHYGPEFPDVEKFSRRYEMNPKFGLGANTGFSRKLDGGWMPIPHISLTDSGLDYEQSVFIAPFDKTDRSSEGIPWQINARPLGVAEYTIANSQAAKSAASVQLSFFSDFKTRKPAEIRVESQRLIAADGDRLLGVVDMGSAPGLSAEAKDGVVTLSGDLWQNSRVRFYVYLPFWEMKPSEQATLTGGQGLRADTEAYWQKLMAPAMQIELPDKLLQNLIAASQVHCINASRSEKDGRTIDPWVAASYYGPIDTESHVIIRGMDAVGQHEYARRSLEYWLDRLNPSGFFSSTYTYGAGVGQHLSAVGDYFQYTRDAAWLNQMAPKVDSICKYIVGQVKKTKRRDPQGEKLPEFGLMTPGRTADWGHWGYTFYVNGYDYQGLHKAAYALKAIGHPEAGRFELIADQFRKEIVRAYRWSQSRTPLVPLRDGTWIAGFPYELNSLGSLEQFYTGLGVGIYEVLAGVDHLGPQGVLNPNGKEIGRASDHQEDIQDLKSADGHPDYEANKEKDWFNWGGLSKGQPYYMRNLELYAMKDDVKPFIRSYFNTAATSISREDLTVWENTWGRSVWNKTHETGEFLYQSRIMLVMEKGDELWLAPFVTNNWLKDKMVVGVKNAPTYFGPVGYTITSRVARGYIEAVIDPPTRQAPKSLVIRLRHPEGKKIRSVLVNGRPHTDFDADKEIVRIAAQGKRLIVRATY